MKKRLLAWVLSFALALSLLPMGALAANERVVFLLLGEAVKIENKEIQFTEPEQWKSGGIWSREKVDLSKPLTLSFEFYMGEGNANSWQGNGADGISVSFTQTLPDKFEEGENQGFYGTGSFGVEYDTWYNSHRGDPQCDHVAIIKDSVSGHVSTKQYTDSDLDDAKWHTTEILYQNGSLAVTVDGVAACECEENILPSVSSAYICIAAATGTFTNRHMVRNVKINGQSISFAGDEEEDLPNSDYSVERDGFCFVNNYEGFNYPENYSIGRERYEEVFGDAGRLLYNTLREDGENLWIGNCYGMSVCSILFENGTLNLQEVCPGVACANDCYDYITDPILWQPDYASIDANSNLAKLIERYQIWQNSSLEKDLSPVYTLLSTSYWKEDSTGKSHRPEGSYMEAVLNVLNGAEQPIMIGIRMDEGGHRVVALPNQDLTQELVDSNGNGTGWYRVQIYDPNHPYWNQNHKQLNELKEYYYNHRNEGAENSYIDINPKLNLFRYSFGGELAGVNQENQTQAGIIFTKDSNGNVVSSCPEYIYLADISGIPVLDETVAKEPESIVPEDNYLLDYQDVITETKVYADEDCVAIIYPGGVCTLGEGVYEVPKVSSLKDSVSSQAGTLLLPGGKTYTLVGSDGSYCFRGDGGLISITLAEEEEASVAVALQAREVSVSSESSSSANIVLANVSAPDKFSSVQVGLSATVSPNIKVALDQSDKLSVQGIAETELVSIDYMTQDEADFISLGEKTSDEANRINIGDLQGMEGIALNENEISLEVGKTSALTVSAIPANKPLPEICWESNRPEVAAVTATGTVTGISQGSAVITAKTKDGVYSAQCSVTVTKTSDSTGNDNGGGSSGGGGGGGGGAAVTTYTLTFDTNGGTAIAKVTKNKGTTIDLSDYTTTREGYTFAGWYADEGLTDKVTSITLNANKTVYAKWTENVPVEPEPTLPFTDVNEGDWFYDAVCYVYENGMMNGVSEISFAPNATTSRAMIVTILYRLENEPAVSGSSFTDVPSGQWYSNAVAWAAEKGIVNGVTDTTFAPNSPITREQMAAILYRYADWKGGDVSGRVDLSGYTDAASVSGYATEAMAWANAEGLITGVTDTTLRPGGSAIRAQAATILMRLCEDVLT